jgi:hypothetical protein
MADATQPNGSSWLSGFGDLMDILGNAAVSGATAYSTIKTAGQAADGQRTPGANAAGTAAVQPPGLTGMPPSNLGSGAAAGNRLLVIGGTGAFVVNSTKGVPGWVIGAAAVLIALLWMRKK